MAAVRLLSLVVSAFALAFVHGHQVNRNAGPDDISKESDTYVVFKPDPADASTVKPKGMHFLRIQKTGGTTFGERIASKFCGPESATCKWATHLDWATAIEDDWQGPVVTLLRDPVERTMSEFEFMRTADGNYSTRQAQWDFRNFTWLNDVDTSPDGDAAFEEYLAGYPDNPSRNRQALYLLGFKKMVQNVPYGEYTYDWDANHDSLVAQAKEHLEAMTAFGITDCFMASMSAFSQQLGWPEDEVLKLAKSVHARKSGKSRQSWRSTLSQDVIDRIERLNDIDMELYSFAKQRFSQRFGQSCS